MKHVSILGAAILSLVTLLPARATDPSPPPTAQAKKSPFEPIAFLVGGVWRGELPPGPNDTPISIEMRAEWLLNHQGIGFNSTYVGNDSRMPYASGSYFWNAAKQRLVFFYSDNEGGLTEGTVTLEGNALWHDFTITNVRGKVDKARAIITALTPDAYSNEIMLEKNGAWQKVVTVRYERIAK